MSKIVDLATAQKVGLNFLESVRPQKKEIAAETVTKTAVKTSERTLELIHQASSLTTFAKRNKTQTRAKLLTLKKDEDPCFYVFNSQEKGFVIVAADDSMEPIIGYSDEGNIDETDMPPALIDYLEDMRSRILQVRKSKISVNKEITSKWEKLKKGNKRKDKEEDDLNSDTGGSGLGSGSSPTAPITPLIKTKWDQGNPYNIYCPGHPPNDCPTGCGATAMAQIMYYYGYPNSYRWGLMPQKLTTSNNFEEIDAVGSLMSDCGTFSNMKYTLDGSGCTLDDNKNALKGRFSYDKGISTYDKKEDDKWEKTLRNEIKKGQPVLYRGQGSGGHAFICDSYDHSTDLFHFNWGWGGNWDGYFTIKGLGPGEDHNYNENNKFLYKIKPSEEVYFMSVYPSHGDRSFYEISFIYDDSIIFPYGAVRVVKGHIRTFTINKNNINYDYEFEHVSVNGVIQNITFDREGIGRIDVVADVNAKSVHVQMRSKKSFELNGIVYLPLEPDYKKVMVVSPSVEFDGHIAISDDINDRGAKCDVVGIKDDAFRNQTRLLSIRISRKALNKIAKSAFSGCTNLQYISINVSDIGDCAFEGCTSIKRITSYSDQPPSCGKDVFKGLSLTQIRRIKLYVYEDSVWAYKSADVWKDFNIVPMEKQSVEYYVAYTRHEQGEHEVHKSHCMYQALTNLGKFNNTGEAVLKALNHYSKTDGCYYCCPEEHTR